MRWFPALLLCACGFIEFEGKDTDTGSRLDVTYVYVLVGDRSSTDLAADAGIDVEGIALDNGTTQYATQVHECEPGPGRGDDDVDCNVVTGTPGSEVVSLGGQGGTLIVGFGGVTIPSGATVTVYEDGSNGSELYDVYVGDSTSSASGTWTTCVGGATGTVSCEVP